METKTQLPTHLDASEAARLRLVTMRLARRLRQQAPEGVTPSQLSAMSTLDRAGAMTMGELAAAERVQPPTMTRIVAGLEEAACVSRERDPGDRRVQRISLTKEGKAFIDKNRTRKTAHLVKLSKKLAPEEVELLVRLTDVLEKLVEDDV
jgi:DNA-binding MarR family transcriptional regulator